MLSSFGDWLGFLAITALATQLVEGFDAKSFAVGGVLAFRLLPSVVLAPVVGVVADRFDRRLTMVVSDVLRFALFLSIPLVGHLTWLLVATALVEVLSLVWIPAKEASVPTLAKERLESANQISLFATYGTAPLAAIVFGVLGAAVGPDRPVRRQHRAVRQRRHLPVRRRAGRRASARSPAGPRCRRERGRRARRHRAASARGCASPAPARWCAGLLIGMLGALAATGVVVGNGKLFTETILDGGEAAFALLFGSVFVGIALGVAVGPAAAARDVPASRPRAGDRRRRSVPGLHVRRTGAGPGRVRHRAARRASPGWPTSWA